MRTCALRALVPPARWPATTPATAARPEASRGGAGGALMLAGR